MCSCRCVWDNCPWCGGVTSCVAPEKYCTAKTTESDCNAVSTQTCTWNPQERINPMSDSCSVCYGFGCALPLDCSNGCDVNTLLPPYLNYMSYPNYGGQDSEYQPFVVAAGTKSDPLYLTGTSTAKFQTLSIERELDPRSYAALLTKVENLYLSYNGKTNDYFPDLSGIITLKHLTFEASCSGYGCLSDRCRCLIRGDGGPGGGFSGGAPATYDPNYAIDGKVTSIPQGYLPSSLTRLYFNGQNLTSMADLSVPETVKELDIKDNKITHLGANDLSMTWLTQFDFSYNPVEYVSKDAFTTLTATGATVN